MVKVSVIIPVYNVEPYIAECLDSILGQTLREIEVICVDDGSTDSSPQILAEYAARDQRVKTLTTPNAGAYRAREAGGNRSSGKYLYFMDSDDVLEPQALEELYDLADRENLDQIIFSASVFFAAEDKRRFKRMAEDYSRYYAVPAKLCGKVMSGRELMGEMLNAGKFHVSPPLRLLRGDMIRTHQWDFPAARSRADNYFTPVSLYLSKRACLVADKYYRRRLRPDSISTASNASAGHFRNTLEVVIKLLRFMADCGETSGEGSMAVHVIRRIFSLEKYMDFPVENRQAVTRDLSASLNPQARVLLHLAVMPLLTKMAARPHTIGQALRFAWNRMMRRIPLMRGAK